MTRHQGVAGVAHDEAAELPGAHQALQDDGQVAAAGIARERAQVAEGDVFSRILARPRAFTTPLGNTHIGCSLEFRRFRRVALAVVAAGVWVLWSWRRP